jgi:hypothetical protein
VKLREALVAMKREKDKSRKVWSAAFSKAAEGGEEDEAASPAGAASGAASAPTGVRFSTPGKSAPASPARSGADASPAAKGDGADAPAGGRSARFAGRTPHAKAFRDFPGGAANGGADEEGDAEGPADEGAASAGSGQGTMEAVATAEEGSSVWPWLIGGAVAAAAVVGGIALLRGRSAAAGVSFRR